MSLPRQSLPTGGSRWPIRVARRRLLPHEGGGKGADRGGGQDLGTEPVGRGCDVRQAIALYFMAAVQGGRDAA